MKHKRSTLFKSVISLLLCFSMLVGTTFAWFTDRVYSANNLIATGVLDVEMEYLDAEGNWAPVTELTEVLNKNALWEPGYTEVAYLKISNVGDLALKYGLGIRVIGETSSINKAGEPFNLSDYIQFGVIESETELPVFTSRSQAVSALTESVAISTGYTSESILYPEAEKDVRYATLVVYMPEEVGNAANYATGATPPVIQLGIQLVATQADHESDSFGTGYDADVSTPGFNFPEGSFGGNASAAVTPDADGKVSENITISGTNTKAEIPAGVQLEEGTEKLTLEVSDVADSEANVTLGKNEEMRSLNVHVQGVSAENTMPMEIYIKEAAAKGLNSTSIKLYHVENGVTVEMTQVDAFTAHNQFKYDPATGDVTLYMATFSEVTCVVDKLNPWEGGKAYDWYIGKTSPYIIANAEQLAGFGAIVGGMADGIDRDTFKDQKVNLICDINLGDKESDNNPELIFYPIGYYYDGSDSAVKPFEGTFDGQGHTIGNFYQNTWEIKGDYDGTYYKDAMGLFGYVHGGTVQNLTVDHFSSDGEFTPTGVIAAYADGEATFQNIAITNCNPRVYNTGNGGIIGIAGDTRQANDDHITLTNITVDNSNKISALWGSYDVACGGLVGMYRGNVDGSGNATGDTISFTNCHVAAQMDVYNDVCGNYQYYAYRYAGMIIGSVRHNTTDDNGKTIPNMKGISAKGCTVNYGTWNDYYYCEFVKNGHPSYSGPDDYKFSRVPHAELNFTDSNGNGIVDADERASVTGCKHDHTDAEDKKAIYLPFHQLFTGYGWGVNSVGLQKYSGIVTDLGITEGDQQESVEKFETKFTGNFLYRVGNLNTVTIGDLFAAVRDEEGFINDAGVYVRIDKLYDDADVTCAFTANATDWTKGTLQFKGTGVVDIVIQDYDYCKPTVLKLEVVDAMNATTATSATNNNVVLLNDCGFSALEVSGGYTLYGNGFTMTCGSDSAALDMGYSFVTLNNGTLDNVQIVTPNFDYAVLYKSNMTESGNRSETTDRTRYFNVKSGVMVSGNSQILNSRVSGGRAAVNVSGGNVVIENSRIELGAVASILVGAANSLTLRDVTLVQKPTASTYDSKKLMGFSVLMICDTNGDAAPVTLEGELVQNAWVDEDDKQYVPSAGQSIISTVLAKTEYLHDIDGDGTNESLNLGFAYMPESLTSKVNTTTITDNRTDKDAVPYDYAEVSILNGKTYVYSYKNTNGTADSFKTESEYTPNKQNDNITVTYSDTADGLTASKSYGTDGWVYELNVDLDKLSGYALDFGKLSMSVNGVTVTDFKVDGNAKPTSPVAVTVGGTTYTLTATVNGKEYSATYKVTGTETSKESPAKISGPTTAGFGVAKSYGGDWSGAADVLTGVKIKYWSVAENKYIEYDFSDFTVPGNAGKLNGTNSYWEYTHTNNDFTFKVTNTVAIHSGNKVFGMPIRGTDGKLYFTISATNGYVGTGTTSRSITMQYEFTDNNGGEKLTFTHKFNISYDEDNQYSYSDLSGSGKLTKLEAGSSSGGTCLAAGTMITLADGSKRAVEDLRKGDLVMAMDHMTGQITANEVIIVVKTAQEDYYKNTFIFDDGTELVTINEHGIFDLDLNKYVNIDHLNFRDFVGHRYISVDASGNIGTKKLVNVTTVRESGYKYDIVTDQTLNYVAEDTLSVTHVLVDVVNSFDFGESLKYDAKKMQADIEKYGLYVYDEWAEYCDISVFEQYNIPVMKVGISKGLYTKEYIIGLINTYVLDESVQIID